MTAARRAIAAAIAAAIALPVAAYLLPIPAILRRVSERRGAQGLASLEVTGTLQASAPGGERLLAAGGIRGAGGLAALPARLLVKLPGRCRLELLPPAAAESERPWVAVRDDAVTGSEELVGDASFVAFARAACALLAVPNAEENRDQPWAASLSRRGVALKSVHLGRFDARVAWVIGGSPTDATPLAWFDKESFQPVRLQYAEGKVATDVRLLGWGSPTGGDWAPRAVEVHQGGALRLRFTTEKASANPKLSDVIF